MPIPSADLANLIRALPPGLVHVVAFTLADAVTWEGQARGERVLELAERYPDHGAELRALALRVGFDPQFKVRAYIPAAH